MSNTSAATDLIPPGNIAHPEACRTFSSSPGVTSFLVQATIYSVIFDEEPDSQGIIARTGKPWLDLNEELTTKEPLEFHIECSFLSRSALRMRSGLQKFYPYSVPYPANSAFPPVALEGHFSLATDDAHFSQGDQDQGLVCGLKLRADDGETWVNPRGSGWELAWQTAPFGINAFWQDSSRVQGDTSAVPDKSAGSSHNEFGDQETDLPTETASFIHKSKPIFEQAPLGPFTPLLLPNGIMNVEGVLAGSELLILDVNEKLQSGGLGRHQNKEDVRGAVNVDPVPEDAREGFTTHFGGRFHEDKTTALPPPFLWSDRGWGILMRDPVAVRFSPLQDGRAILNLNMRAGSNGLYEYIIMVGDALEACKEEYPVE